LPKGPLIVAVGLTGCRRGHTIEFQSDWTTPFYRLDEELPKRPHVDPVPKRPDDPRAVDSLNPQSGALDPRTVDLGNAVVKDSLTGPPTRLRSFLLRSSELKVRHSDP
jgi:hypothetical protein